MTLSKTTLREPLRLRVGLPLAIGLGALAVWVGPARAHVPAARIAPDVGDERTSVQLPEGPTARAWAGVGPETQPVGIEIGEPSPDGIPWSVWARALAAAVDSQENAQRAEAHAQLALIARGTGRHADAWRHFAATGSEPPVCAGLLAGLAPGVDAELLAALEPGGTLGQLPEGVLLSPAVPPPMTLPDGRLAPPWAPSRIRIDRLRIGEALIRVVVRREAEGVQIDLEHIEGEPCTLRVRIPEPDGYEVRVEYVEWYRRDTVGEPHEVRLEAGRDEPLTLFGRMLPRADAGPTRLPESLPLALEAAGVRILAAPETEVTARGLAAAWEALLDVDVVVHLGLPSSAETADPRLSVDLSGPAAVRKAIGLQSLTESFLLDPR